MREMAEKNIITNRCRKNIFQETKFHCGTLRWCCYKNRDGAACLRGNERILPPSSGQKAIQNALKLNVNFALVISRCHFMLLRLCFHKCYSASFSITCSVHTCRWLILYGTPVENIPEHYFFKYVQVQQQTSIIENTILFIAGS